MRSVFLMGLPRLTKEAHAHAKRQISGKGEKSMNFKVVIYGWSKSVFYYSTQELAENVYNCAVADGSTAVLFKRINGNDWEPIK